MIRKLTKNDKETVINYLKQEAEYNIFITGDIENYGFDDPIMDIWGDFSDNNEYKAVLLRYLKNYLIYTHNISNYDYSGFLEIIEKQHELNNLEIISGKKEITDKIYPLLKNNEHYKRRPCHFARCVKINPEFKSNSIDKVMFATENEVSEIISMLNENIIEFDTQKDDDVIKDGVRKGSNRITYIRDEKSKKIISTAQTTAESSQSAMVVGVASHPDFRRYGYASACVYALIRSIIEEGRTACLFYDNPKAGDIYKRIGFEDMGFWEMLVLEKP